MKKTRLLTIFILIISMLSTLVLSVSAEGATSTEPTTNSRYILLADADSGRILYERDSEVQAFPASLTKIMTVYVALEAVEAGTVKLTDQVTVSQTSMQGMIDEGSTANIVPGEIMTLKDLLYCAMLSSANEACNIIAEHVSGSIDEYVVLMNEKAAALGCADTNFTNTHGLPDTMHYTTARDMLTISLAAWESDLFREISGTKEYAVPATNMSGERILSNSNSLINANSYYPGYYYAPARGIKTGFTSAAGYCLSSVAVSDDVELMAIVMGGQSWTNDDGSLYYGNFADSIALYEWGFENFSVREILSTSRVVDEVSVELAEEGDTLTLLPSTPVAALMPNNADISEYDLDVILYHERDGEVLEAPIDAGETLGEVSVSRDGVLYGSAYLVASTSVSLQKIEYMRNEISEALDLFWVQIIFWVLVVLLLAYGLLVVRYRILHKRHVKAREEVRRRRKSQAQDAQRPVRAVEVRREKETVPLSEKPSAPQKPTPPRSTAHDRDYFDEFFGQDKKGGKK